MVNRITIPMVNRNTIVKVNRIPFQEDSCKVFINLTGAEMIKKKNVQTDSNF